MTTLEVRKQVIGANEIPKSMKWIRAVGGPNDGQLLEFNRGRKTFRIDAEWCHEYLPSVDNCRTIFLYSGMVRA